MTGCSKSLAIFLKERHPKTVEKMSNLADQFIEAHGYSAFSKDIQVFQKNTSPETQKKQPKSQSDVQIEIRSTRDKGQKMLFMLQIWTYRKRLFFQAETATSGNTTNS